MKNNYLKLKLLNSNRHALFISVVLLLFVSASGLSQSISATNGATNCGACAPPGWFNAGGTPDVSSATIVAGSGAGYGAPEPWLSSPLPLPLNNHANWITLRDVGTLASEETISTNMTSLVVGREYEVTVYSMSSRTATYSPMYINAFDYQIGSNARVQVSPVSQDVWGVNKARFTADNTTMSLFFYPRNDMGSNLANLESVNLSVTLNAINNVPVADDNSDATTEGVPVSFNVVSTDIDYDGNIVASTVDLNPITQNIDVSRTVIGEGDWVVNPTGVVTFTPQVGFTGNANLT